MGRYFWQPILGWVSGFVLCIIITSVVLKLGWKSPYEVLLWGYATIGSVSVFAWTQFAVRKKEDRMELESKLKEKADVKDIDNLKCQIDIMHQTVEHIAQSQQEEHATIDNIYNLMLNKKL